MKKMLVVYYSWSNGNTKRIAEQLTNGTGADIARIETTEPYSGSHEDVVEQGKREVEAGFMPQINPISVNLADYDVIAIGTPTWWYTMAPAVLSESPSQGSGCILSDILMEDVPEKYYLSQKQMEQLLYKSMLANREKESTQKKD